jgi:hypothetical protein
MIGGSGADLVDRLEDDRDITLETAVGEDLRAAQWSGRGQLRERTLSVRETAALEVPEFGVAGPT